MTDYVATSTPPLIPGDIQVRNVSVDKRAKVDVTLALPVYTTAGLPSSTLSPIGTVVMNIDTNKLNYVSSSHTWLATS